MQWFADLDDSCVTLAAEESAGRGAEPEFDRAFSLGFSLSSSWTMYVFRKQSSVLSEPSDFERRSVILNSCVTPDAL